ncbi:MAG TPA: hypothetical protein DDW76_36220 [Cyanobacteria bacterium UBA11369]|nr:hypothetical protein [Cyanobacteria bacterium UBA11371]HBE31648.1 hypothetical protein [Cyanobacteria bacterium UBA11368]HBE54055.1 hypothetical protein [Cyanobacteria bacterium UBA11369]
MDIKTDEYTIYYEPESKTVFFQGMLRLNGIEEYQPVIDLLNKTAEQTSAFTLDLRQLQFLNSSGISMLSMFAIQMRQKPHVQLTLLGASKIPWQMRSLRNLQRLMPSLQLKFA